MFLSFLEDETHLFHTNYLLQLLQTEKRCSVLFMFTKVIVIVQEQFLCRSKLLYISKHKLCNNCERKNVGYKAKRLLTFGVNLGITFQ
jgi:hypothetical protein